MARPEELVLAKARRALSRSSRRQSDGKQIGGPFLRRPLPSSPRIPPQGSGTRGRKGARRAGCTSSGWSELRHGSCLRFGSRETLTSPRKGAAGKRSSLADKPRRGHSFCSCGRASVVGREGGAEKARPPPFPAAAFARGSLSGSLKVLSSFFPSSRLRHRGKREEDSEGRSPK